MSATTTTTTTRASSRATPERAAELGENLSEIRGRIESCLQSTQRSTPSTTTSSSSGREEIAETSNPPLLVAVSKYKPASDILACYEHGQRDFGENYVQELVEKARELPQDIRWHFIGTFQTNKAKLLASIPNLHALQTLSSIKGADALNKALPPEREGTSFPPAPLNVLLQVNTSGEDAKSGLPPLASSESESESSAEIENDGDGDGGDKEVPELLQLALHVLDNCPRLYLQGLMTIGSLSESLSSSFSSSDENRDFRTLVKTRDRLEELLRKRGKWPREEEEEGGRRGRKRLLLSMGMSSDFEAAVKAGSDVVRVGTGIFGQRRVKGEK